MKEESQRHTGVAESRARNVLDKALRSVDFFSTKAKAKVSTALEKGKLHKPVSEPSPRPSVDESSHSQVDEEVLDTIDDVEASLQELRALKHKAAKSFAVPPLKLSALEARKPSIMSPKLTSESPEERVQRAKSESAARDQWHQQRRLHQELQHQGSAHTGTRQKLRWGSQEHPSSNSLHGEASSRRSSAELQRHQSGAATSGSTLDPQHALLRTKSRGSSRNSLEQQEGPAATSAAAAAPRRSSLRFSEGAPASRRNSSMSMEREHSLEQQEGTAAAAAAAAAAPRRSSLRFLEGAPASRRNSSMSVESTGGFMSRKSCLMESPGVPASRRNSSMSVESTGGGSMSRKSCPLARFEASTAQPPDHTLPAPSEVSNTAHLSPRGSLKGVSAAHQHHELPPPVAPSSKRRSSMPECLLQRGSLSGLQAPDHTPPLSAEVSNIAHPSAKGGETGGLKGRTPAYQQHELAPPSAPASKRRSSLPEYLLQGLPDYLLRQRGSLSGAQPPDHAPSDVSNDAHPIAKGSSKGGATAQQHHELPPPVLPSSKRRGSLPEYFLPGGSLLDERQQPFMLTPDPSNGAHNERMPPQSHSGPLNFCRAEGRPLPGRFSQLQLRTDLSSPSPSLSPNHSTAPNTLASISPSSSGPLASMPSLPAWLALANPTGSSTQHQQIARSPSSGPLPSLHSSSSTTTASLQAQKALKPSTPTSQSGPLWPLPPNARHSQLLSNAQHTLGAAACPPPAADEEGQHSAVRDASAVQAPPPAKGEGSRFMFATQSSINRASERQLDRSGSSKKRSSQTGHRLSHSTSSCRRRLKRNSSSGRLSQGKRSSSGKSNAGKRASSTGRPKAGQLSRSSSRKGPPSRTSSRKSQLSSTSRGSLPQSKDSQPSRTGDVFGDGSDDVSDAGSDTPSVSSAVSSVSQATLGADADCATREPEEAVPGLLEAASYENGDNKGAPLQPSILGHATAPSPPPSAGFHPMKHVSSASSLASGAGFHPMKHVSSNSSLASASSVPLSAAAPGAGTVAESPLAGGSSAEGASNGKPTSKSAPRRRVPTKQPSNVRFNLPTVAPPHSPHPPEEPTPPTHTGRVSAIPAAIPATKSKSTPTTAASSPGVIPSPKDASSRASVEEGLSMPAALAKEALAELPSTYGKISKQTASLRQYLAGNRLDVSRLDLDTYLKKLDNENKGRSRSVGRFAGNKRQDRSKSKNPPQRGVCAGEGDSPEENGTSGTAPQGAGNSLASMFAQLGQEEQELQQLHERMRAAAVKAREHGSGVDQCSMWRG